MYIITYLEGIKFLVTATGKGEIKCSSNECTWSTPIPDDFLKAQDLVLDHWLVHLES